MRLRELGRPAKTGRHWYLRSYGRAAVRLLLVVLGAFPITLLAVEKVTLHVQETSCLLECPPANEVASNSFGFDVTASLYEQFVAFLISRIEPFLVLAVVLGLAAVVLQWYNLRDGPGLGDHFRLR